MIRRVLLTATLAVVACGGGDEASDYAATRAEADRLEQTLPIVTDSVATVALEAIGSSLVAASGPSEHPWRFRLVQDTTLNAFALPGGFVYVHTALVRAARNVDELAGVMGHEVAHARLRHGAKQQDKATAGTVAISLVCGVTGWCSGAMAQAAIRVGASATFAKFSRTDELQADSAGLLYSARAGYDPRGIITFFETLQASDGGATPAAMQFFASHPMEKTRIARAKRLLPKEAPKAPAPEAMRSAFEVLKRELANGRSLPATVPERPRAPMRDSSAADAAALDTAAVPLTASDSEAIRMLDALDVARRGAAKAPPSR